MQRVEVEMQNNLEGTPKRIIEILMETIKQIRSGESCSISYPEGDVFVNIYDEDDVEINNINDGDWDEVNNDEDDE